MSPLDGYSALLRLHNQKSIFESRKYSIPILVERLNAIALSDLDIYDGMLSAGEAYHRNGMHGQAHQWYRRAIEFDSTRMNGHTSEGYLYLDDKLYPQADENFRRAIDVAPEAMDGYWGMAFVAEEQGDWAAALHWCEESLTRRPQWSGFIQARMDKIKQLLNAPNESLEEFFKALKVDPKNNDAFQGIERSAEAYFNAGRLTEFEELFEKSGVLGSEPAKKAVIYNRIGNLLFEKNQYQEAITYYGKAVNLDKQTPIYECNLGRAYGNLPTPNWDEMIEHCQRAAELRREVEDEAFGLDYYYDFLSEAYFNAGRLTAFEELFEKSGVLGSEPAKKAVIYNRIGNLLFEKNQYQEAITYYGKAVNLDKQTPIYECNLGRAYGNLPTPNWDEMIEHCQRAAELRREVEDEAFGLDYYYDFLSEAYFNAGRLTAFEELFEKSGVLGSEPAKKAVIYNRIGNLLFQKSQYKESIAYYGKAAELSPQVAAYHANLGGAHVILGQSENAINEYEQAINLEPKVAVYKNQLGNIYFGKGNYIQAINYYKEAIVIGKETQDVISNRVVYCRNLAILTKLSGNWRNRRRHTQKRQH